jgi:hypothetical protein
MNGCQVSLVPPDGLSGIAEMCRQTNKFPCETLADAKCVVEAASPHGIDASGPRRWVSRLCR